MTPFRDHRPGVDIAVVPLLCSSCGVSAKSERRIPRFAGSGEHQRRPRCGQRPSVELLLTLRYGLLGTIVTVLLGLCRSRAPRLSGVLLLLIALLRLEGLVAH